MARKANKISTRWNRETREAFRDFLDKTNFPDPERLIMFIAILLIKLKIKSNVQIYKMPVR